MPEAPDPIMISALEHYSYCPRQCALIHLEQQFADNIHTARGNAVHERVDVPGWEMQPGARIERALPIWSERLGLIGRCDAVEFRRDGSTYPVETKHGPRRPKAHDDLQLAAQALCLEEMTGRQITAGAIFHYSSRRRREVIIGPELRRAVEQTVAAIRAMLELGTPPPAPCDERCRECSLADICQPKAMVAKVRLHQMRARLYEPDPEP